MAKTRAAEVAKAAGVSPATVDRVLNGRGGVRADKERRVLEWAHRLGLDRNLQKRPLRMIRVGVVMAPPTNPFYESLRQAFAKANRLYFPVNVQCSIHYLDILAPAATAALLRRVAATHDALVVVLAEHPSIAAALEDITAQRPVVTIVTDLPASGRLAYVGLDNRSAGRVAGDLMGRFLGPPGGDVLVVSGLHSMVALGDREMGFRAVLAERHPRCRLVGVVESREQHERVGELVADAFRAHPDIAGIYNTSGGNRGIADTLRRLGRAGETVLITHELSPERRALLREGVIDAIIDQNPELEVLTSVETLLHHLGRQDVPPERTITPFTIYFRENC
jgi:LacI family transcriptional regulator